MTPAQSRMARAALNIGIRELAKRARVAPSTISRLEAGDTLQPRTVDAIRQALERAGVQFIDGDEPGVRIKKSKG
jgi:transcriptional regulator with XRE-family HTH domain